MIEEIKLKFKSGKEIVLNKEELNELENFLNRNKTNEIYIPYYPQATPYFPQPTYPQVWYGNYSVSTVGTSEAYPSEGSGFKPRGDIDPNPRVINTNCKENK